MTVWVVFVIDPYERGSAWVDSVWSTREGAENRKTERGWGDIEIEEIVVDTPPTYP